LSVDLTSECPMLRIRGESQKSGNAEFCPVPPEFGEWLPAVPAAERRGRVFKLAGATGVIIDERTKRRRRPGR
jgi:hypothetical protein